MRMYKIAETPRFMVLAADATMKGYNRQLDLNKLAEIIDPLGVHVVSFAMLHEHIAGERVAPHMRTMWLVKTKGNGTSCQEVALDISMENFKNLKEVPPVRTKITA